jgi:hypothetical protein
VWLAGASSVPQSRACARSQRGSVNRGANAANTALTSAGGVNISGHHLAVIPQFTPQFQKNLASNEVKGLGGGLPTG